MFEGFTRMRIKTGDPAINLVRGGEGPPLLLLHGYPQTHVMWHKIAPRLAIHFTVVATDLRGYGDSDKPPAGDDHSGYSKRAMAQDQIEVMECLGFDQFYVVGHDRGARVGHRMALDHSECVKKLVVLDVVATHKIFQSVDKNLATAYFHWFLMLQPAPLAETMIGNNAEFYLRWLLDRWCTVPGAITEEAFAEYYRCFKIPESIHATCEDYRAVSVDLIHDEADLDRKVTCPVLALWGTNQAQHPGWPSVAHDVVATWKERAIDVRGKQLPGGHFLPEEAPDETFQELFTFLTKDECLSV